ncbi:hypothetical protein EC973_008805 [Apophysomyces ossiformis]|uniref:Uncharacterized protein n=1 Tax=Apophysomyces ossiformis TaxID=679940 RepID=A0A8H7EVB2_9FUNG|nr:hypothetical protein EC973_008805 [Apophysomyces ossiformis]
MGTKARIAHKTGSMKVMQSTAHVSASELEASFQEISQKRQTEVENEHIVHIKKQKYVVDDDDLLEDNISTVSGVTYDTEIEVTFWDTCRDLLQEAAEDDNISDYSPEKHGIIVCGEHIKACTESIPNEIYQKIVEQIKGCKYGNTFADIFQEEKGYIERVLDAKADDTLKEARSIPNETTNRKKTEFLSDMLLFM